jgi:hypothetical protein
MNHDSTQFKWAMRNIQTFTDSNEGHEIPSIAELDVQNNEIVLPKQPRIVELANFLFSLTMSENSPQKNVLDLLLKSSEVIKNYSGPLSNSDQKIINRYNEMVEMAKTPPKTLRGRLEKRMNESRGLMTVSRLDKIPAPIKFQIEIPQFCSYSLPLGERKSISIAAKGSAISQKVSGFSQHVKTELSPQTMDMYRMRAIRLLEEQGLCNRFDARTAVMNFPIDIKCSDEACEITQRFPTVNGPAYKIFCRFLRDKPSGDYRSLVESTIQLDPEDLKSPLKLS